MAVYFGKAGEVFDTLILNGDSTTAILFCENGYAIFTPAEGIKIVPEAEAREYARTFDKEDAYTTIVERLDIKES